MYDKPRYQEFHVAGIKHIDPVTAWDMLQKEDVVLLDIRESFELNHQCLKLVPEKQLHIPMMTLMDRLEEIPANKTILVICAVGERSAKITNLLIYQGFPNVLNLDGGLKACHEQGLPFAVNNTAGCDSHCDCGSCDSGCC